LGFGIEVLDRNITMLCRSSAGLINTLYTISVITGVTWLVVVSFHLFF